MTRASIGISTSFDPETAGRRASEEALEAAGAEGAACAVVLGTAAHGAALERAVAEAARSLGTECVVGGSVDGLMAGDRFVEGNPGVAVLALARCAAGGEDTLAGRYAARRSARNPAALAFVLRDLSGAEDDAGEEVLDHIGGVTKADDLLLLFADSHALLAQPLLASIARALSPATVVGLGASPIPGAGPLVWGQADVAGSALAGLLLRGAGPAWVGIGNACRPASGELLVTRARGNWVLGLDGRPALDVYREVSGVLPGEGNASPAPALMAALPVEWSSGAGETGCREGFLERGTFRVRDIVGIDPDRRGFSVPEPMASGRPLAFVRGDSHQAAADLEAMLSDGAPRAAALGLHFASAPGSVGAMGGAAATHAFRPAPLARRLDGVPVVGGVGAYQIGPVAQAGAESSPCELLTHSELLVLLPR